MQVLEKSQNDLALTTQFVDCLFHTLRTGATDRSFQCVNQAIAANGFSVVPLQWLFSFREALTLQNWDVLSECFSNQSFIGRNGYFIWIAPFSIRRQGRLFQELTGIFGKELPLDRIQEFPIVQDLQRFQKSSSVPGEILPVESYRTFGYTGSDYGEAFLAPDGWRFKGSEQGPGLNDLFQQRTCFLSYGAPAIRSIFDEHSAELLLHWSTEPSTGYKIQNLEFQFHEMGHATGFGLNHKIKNQFFLTPWYAAVEEWRSDGVGIATAIEALSDEDAARVIAANLCLRFGTDSQREGGLELDSDVNAGLLLFDRLLQAGFLELTIDHRLRLPAKKPLDLLELAGAMSNDALQLTRNEIQLRDVQGAWNLYGSVSVSGSSRTLFNHFVRGPNSALECKLL